MTTITTADGGCILCPRRCGRQRTPVSRGLCGSAESFSQARVAYSGLHRWEEPCLSGTRGSGTIFLSGCSLGCAFCQNGQISNAWTGETLDAHGLADRMLKLRDDGAHNINLVTAAHVLPAVADGIRLAKAQGMDLPVVWNTGGYETVNALRMLDGLIDIYLPDLKFEDSALSEALCGAPDYATVAHEAILEMHRQTGMAEWLEGDLLQHGLIVRHLVLPGCHRDSMRVLEWLAVHLPLDTRLSILSQYTPMPGAMRMERVEGTLAKSLGRTVTTFEYRKVIDKAISLGFTRILGQERTSATTAYIPPFSSGSGAGAGMDSFLE